jgi:mRNA interferase MazF
VLVAFPFVSSGIRETKRRPALVVQADRYNRKRAAVILAAIRSSNKSSDLPCKVDLAAESVEGRAAGIRTDSVIDCQTLITLMRSEVVARLGHLDPTTQQRVDQALDDALGLVRTRK